MYFDIIVPTDIEDAQVFNYGRDYLEMKEEEGQKLSTTQCKFCHIEQAQEHVEKAINSKGYFILEMEGC